MECLTRTSNEFACFVAGEIIQVIEAISGSVVPLAMFYRSLHYMYGIYGLHGTPCGTIECIDGVGHFTADGKEMGAAQLNYTASS